MTYEEFLKRKVVNKAFVGVPVDSEQLSSRLKPFQNFSTRIALNKGRFALFEDCGLGKTFQALEWSRIINEHTQKPILNLAPLAVVGQTIDEGKKFGIEVTEYDRNSPIQISNYEQLENIDFSIFGGVVGDEISIIKNTDGKIRNKLIQLTRHIPYKLGCSATPSPNDPMELGSIAEWLGVMNYNEMLATYFTHDGGETAKWKIKGHAVDTFWKWVNSWSLMFSKPSDIGFEDEGYILPQLNFIERQITTPRREGHLYNDVAVNASNFHKEVRLTKFERLSEVISIVNNSPESFIVWVEQNPEGDYLEKQLHGAIQVTGTDTDQFKKDHLLGFGKNEFRVLVTKAKIASFGMNYQNCHNMVFASPDFSFEKMYQAIRRELRYGQEHAVNAYVMTTDTMQNIAEVFRRKQRQHENMQQQMIKHTKELYYEYRRVA